LSDSGKDVRMRRRTITWQHANVVLGGALDEFVTSRRADGKGWRLIARELWAATDGQVSVTHESLRRWYEAASGEAA
jgi:hypothetical protein